MYQSPQIAVITLHTSQLLAGSTPTMGINNTSVSGQAGNVVYGL